MAQFKLVISDTKGKSITQELKDRAAQPLLGTKIGGIIDSAIIGVAGGKLKITGGSDKSGTPMRSDVHGGVKKYVLLSKGVGMQSIEEGNRTRKLIRGNMVTEEIYQLNCLLVEGKLPEKEKEAEVALPAEEPPKKKKEVEAAAPVAEEEKQPKKKKEPEAAAPATEEPKKKK